MSISILLLMQLLSLSLWILTQYVIYSSHAIADVGDSSAKMIWSRAKDERIWLVDSTKRIYIPGEQTVVCSISFQLQSIGSMATTQDTIKLHWCILRYHGQVSMVVCQLGSRILRAPGHPLPASWRGYWRGWHVKIKDNKNCLLQSLTTKREPLF